MASAVITTGQRGVLREPWDALLIGLALLQAVVLVALPTLPVIAIGLWWNSNTIAHYFLHTPFFRSRALNTCFALYLSVLLGIPQSVWRERHLAHHAGRSPRLRLHPQLLVESMFILALWSALVLTAPWFFVTVYVPGYLLGLTLCGLHGYYEHARGTTSHYGRVYNWLFFNDGYHVEHHAAPGVHWSRLPSRIQMEAVTSRWPAVLRWLEVFSLEGLERRAVGSRFLQGLLLRTHERALQELLPLLPAVRRVGIVGGGLFPRTVLLLEKLLPEADLVVIDGSPANLATAQSFLPRPVASVQAWYDPVQHNGFDLLVIPLAYVGDRQWFYQHPPAPAVLVHEWIWRRRGHSAVVSWWLLKRLNLIRS